MSLMQEINKRLGKGPEATKPSRTASQFIQAARAKANEARDMLRPKEAVSKTPSSNGKGSTPAPRGQDAVVPAPQAARAAQGRADPLPHVRKHAGSANTAAAPAASTALSAGVDPRAAGASKTAAQVVKDVREVANGPRGGKFVHGPNGSKHYVK